MDIEGKRVVVTGAGANIGEAIAVQFAQAGARVVVHVGSNTDGGARVVQKIRSIGGEAQVIQADLTESRSVDRLFEEVVAVFGGVDILINNAGAARPTPFSDSSIKQWQDVFNINFFSAVLCSQRAAALMKRSGGAIVNTSSIRGIGHTGREGLMAYSAAKAAMISFTKTLAKELAPSITVNAVAPGFVLTSAYDSMPAESKQAFLDATLIKRWITPEELAPAYIYLASQPGVTGQVLTVDGGFTLKTG
jgi:3-oxoacyl-[acyl-carrier protein] reductase